MSHGNGMMAGTDGRTECGPSFIAADAQELDFGGGGELSLCSVLQI